ncbi:MAG: hypothetical protein JOZ95_18315, partial [Solirubrobacterales bacterium]|nr:hypothetical protein [Solirubrobacterales bacterium]
LVRAAGPEQDGAVFLTAASLDSGCSRWLRASADCGASNRLGTAIADVIEEETQLLLVILADHLAGRAAARLFVLYIADPHAFGHTRNLPRAPACAHHVWAPFSTVLVARPVVDVSSSASIV